MVFQYSFISTNMKYKKKIQDFLDDPTFVNWANGTNEKDLADWNARLIEYPELAASAKKAKLIVKGISFRPKEVPQENIDRNWNRLMNTLELTENKEIRQLPGVKRWMSIAAALFFLLAATWGIYQFFQSPDTLEFRTATGETKNVPLPDGSSLLLNANSKVQFSSDWSRKDIRTIELVGEAFFKVAKQPKGGKFRVQTPNLVVEVLGTEFNFNNKRAHAIVSLVKGEIDLIKPGLTPKTLQAGQTAWFDEERRGFQIVSNKTAYWSNWTVQKWSFGDGTPMAEVLKRIKETYGLDYEVTDPGILKKMASGDVSIESRTVLLESLSYLLDLKMTVKNDKLIVSPAESDDLF